jgi:L-threonylcarbamoyladenylate synthase
MLMKSGTENLPLGQTHSLARAAAVIKAGGLIAFPTDTVYGIGASAFLPSAIERIYQAKERDHLKAIPILMADTADLTAITPQLSRIAEKLIGRFWPGSLTLVLPLRPSLPDNLSPAPTIGVRIPDHDLARELLRSTGPLAATSANLSGQAPALTADQVIDQLGDQLELILDGGPTPGGIASTVVDCTGEEPQLLRDGPLPWSAILDALDSDD